MTSSQFFRVGRVLSMYDEARARGEKHSAAVRSAVEAIRRADPEIAISETEVKRTLAVFWPRGSKTVVRFERSALTEEDKQKNRWIRQQLARWQGKKGVKLPDVRNCDAPGATDVLRIRFGERPAYPRHNRKV